MSLPTGTISVLDSRYISFFHRDAARMQDSLIHVVSMKALGLKQPFNTPDLLVVLCIDGRQGLDLPYQKTFLIRELIIIRPVFEKPGQEGQEPIAVVDQYSLHCRRFVRVRHKDLEDLLSELDRGSQGNGQTLKTWNPSYCTIFLSSFNRFMHSFRCSPRATYSVITL